MPKIKITETVFRDGHQSLIATRMTTEEIVPILSAMDQIGYHSLEAWGGATFDACLRFLNEDPWERLRAIRAGLKNTKLQALFRGQNLLGYRHYSDDVVEYFIQKAIANGVDIIRIFDALNDARNLKTSIKATKREGGHIQTAISYTTSPVHTNAFYAEYAKRLEDMGADSICIKDMSGLLTPYACYDLIKTLKANVSIPIQLHTHYTSGLASMTLIKGVEAGADIILLDNFSVENLRKAVELIGDAAWTEISGGVSLESLPVLGTVGADFVSCGALTHNVPWIDIGLDWK